LKLLNLKLLFLTSVFISLEAQASGPFIIKKNNEAATLLQNEKTGEAQRVLSDLVVQAPFEPAVRLNLGFAFEKNGDPIKCAVIVQVNPQGEFAFSESVCP
jgi:hypothetical protein